MDRQDQNLQVCPVCPFLDGLSESAKGGSQGHRGSAIRNARNRHDDIHPPYVPDGPVIGRNAAGVLGLVRTPASGDLYKTHLGRLDWMDRFASGYGMPRVTTLAELMDAKAKGEPAVIQDIEGCDFLDGKLERPKRLTGVARV
jgi:hypothetical protein